MAYQCTSTRTHCSGSTSKLERDAAAGPAEELARVCVPVHWYTMSKTVRDAAAGPAEELARVHGALRRAVRANG
jgi:hypothetical protein